METIYMKLQILFYVKAYFMGEVKKKIKMLSAENFTQHAAC